MCFVDLEKAFDSAPKKSINQVYFNSDKEVKYTKYTLQYSYKLFTISM